MWALGRERTQNMGFREKFLGVHACRWKSPVRECVQACCAFVVSSNSKKEISCQLIMQQSRGAASLRSRSAPAWEYPEFGIAMSLSLHAQVLGVH